MTHALYRFSASVLLAFSTGACVEDGFSPDCPTKQDYEDQDGVFDFAAWRKDAEQAGCVTPIGGPDGVGGGSK